MREIRFRAIHKLTKHWFEDIHIIYQDGEWFEDYRAFEDGRPMNLDQVAIIQYTGLKDKNGTGIYEGDILSTDLDRPYLIVEFRNGAFMFQCHDNGKDYYDFMATTGENYDFTKYHEIIGNIYENPELLERSE